MVNMSGAEGITQELDLGGVISKTFELYRRDFAKYLILFVAVEAIVGVFSTLVRRAIAMPAPPDIATPEQLLRWLPGFLGAVITVVALMAIVALVLYTLSFGSAVKLASEAIVRGQTDLVASVRFTVSRIVWLWLVGIVVSIIICVGFIALIVPGIILMIMFSLVLPVIIIEGSNFESLDRSRQLVSHRWLKTLALVIVFAIIVGIASAIVDLISTPFGVASTIVNSILSSFYLPIIPIAQAVYYHSNAARVASPQMIQAPTASGATLQAGMRFCTNCGTQIASTMTFCPACGAKQPT